MSAAAEPAVFKPLSPEGRAVRDALRALKVDEVLTYHALRQLTKLDALSDEQFRSFVGRHKAAVMNREDYVFEPVAGVGVRRIAGQAVVDRSAGFTRRIRRIARKGVKELATVDPASLPAAKLPAYNLQCATLGVLAHASSPSAQRRLTQRASAKIEMGDTLAALKEASEK